MNSLIELNHKQICGYGVFQILQHEEEQTLTLADLFWLNVI